MKLEKTLNWRETKNKLPETKDNVLFIIDGVIDIGFFRLGVFEHFYPNQEVHRPDEVTHWLYTDELLWYKQIYK